MILRRLELFNFRNYRRLDIELPPGANLLSGRNAQGKTNLLEAIYFLSHLRSRRVPRLRDMVMESEEAGSVRGLAEEGQREVSVRAGLGRAGRVVEVNGRKVEPVSRAVGVVKCVMFEPGDLYLVKGEPSRRREFLDETIEVTCPEGAGAVSRYRHLLRQRNAVLRKWEAYGSGLESVLEPWSEKLAEAAGIILSQRLESAGRMAELVGGSYAAVSGCGGAVTFRYECTSGAAPGEPGISAEAMKEALVAALPEDRRSRTTTVGPHRDDVEILIDGRDARYQASQGEQRTLAFAMRFAQKEYIRELTAEEPVLLLDDVLSELDEARRGRVFDMAAGCGQSLITATEVPPEVRSGVSGVFEVEGGKITVG